jgi:hypothetical protein
MFLRVMDGPSWVKIKQGKNKLAKKLESSFRDKLNFCVSKDSTKESGDYKFQ